MSGKKKYEQVFEALRSQILSGDLKAGDRLPSEPVLAARFGVATMTLRRALKGLEERGHLIRRPYHGTFVTAVTEGETMGKRRNWRVGLVVPGDLSSMAHPVFSRFINGVEGVFSEQGVQIELVVSNPANTATEEAFLKTIAQAQLDGWILPAKFSGLVRAALLQSGAPKILLHFPDEALSGHFFEADPSALSSQIAHHLLENGYRHPALLTVTEALSLRDQFIPLFGEIIEPAGGRVVLQEVTDWSVAAGAIACEAVLARHPETDALVCDDDEVALGAISHLKARGILPPQIGVVGAGDFPAGLLIEPSLTTVAFPFYQVGRDSAGLMVDLIHQRSVEPAHRRFLPKLIVRESTKNQNTPSPYEKNPPHPMRRPRRAGSVSC